MTENKKFRHHKHNNLKFAKRIQENARKGGLPNMVSKYLTECQAISIYLRSRQLQKEGAFHPHLISPDAKKKQIDECYKQREEQMRSNDLTKN